MAKRDSVTAWVGTRRHPPKPPTNFDGAVPSFRYGVVERSRISWRPRRPLSRSVVPPGRAEAPLTLRPSRPEWPQPSSAPSPRVVAVTQRRATDPMPFFVARNRVKERFRRGSPLWYSRSHVRMRELPMHDWLWLGSAREEEPKFVRILSTLRPEVVLERQPDNVRITPWKGRDGGDNGPERVVL